ncbi:hypothetical protein BGZ68_009659 [Mortierella alpina]|nr:hypothetical protein BGZ68_009659 [Mortierella alpina]
MRLSKTLLISAALAAFVAVAVAQDTPSTENPTTEVAAGSGDTSDNVSDAIVFSDDVDGADDGDDGDDDADGDDTADDNDNANDNGVAAGTDDDADDNGADGTDDGEAPNASAVVKRATRRHKRRSVSGKTIAIDNEKQFCLFLPAKKGADIAKHERTAVAFCTNPHNSETPGARKFPGGFIKSHHLAVMRGVNHYLQVTGRIDRSKYDLSKHDQGGQYDIKATADSSCAGFNHFVQLIEPNENIYCLRCCMNKKDCPTYKSEKGCRAIFPNANFN